MDSFKDKVKTYFAISLKTVISELWYFTSFCAIWGYGEPEFEFSLLGTWRISKILAIIPIVVLTDFTIREHHLVSYHIL